MKSGLIILLGTITFIVVLFSLNNIYHNYYLGDYIIRDMNIGNTYNGETGQKYCDNCLWIKFDEGCNREFTSYFENQHELDERLKIGQSVRIDFWNCGENGGERGCIKGVYPTPKYNYKCFTSIEDNLLTNALFIFISGIISLIVMILLIKCVKDGTEVKR
jgi:hypothetical protein